LLIFNLAASTASASGGSTLSTCGQKPCELCLCTRFGSPAPESVGLAAFTGTTKGFCPATGSNAC
jgi:hypothetical protein